MNKVPEGIQMRCTAEHAVEDARIVRFTMQVWPLPVELLADFQKFMEAGAGEYLTKVGLVTGERIDLTKRGALQ